MSDSPRTDLFVSEQPSVSLVGVASLEVIEALRDLMIDWATHARTLELELAAANAALKTVRPFRAGYNIWLKEHAAAIERARKG